MTQSQIRKPLFKCNIQPINSSNTMSLFTGPYDFEFEHFLKYIVIKLGGQIKNPKIEALKLPNPRKRLGRKEQAVMMVLQMINQSPDEKRHLQSLLSEYFSDKDDEINDSIDDNSSKEYSCSREIFTIIEEENDDFDSRLENNKELQNRVQNKMFLGKRGDGSFKNSF